MKKVINDIVLMKVDEVKEGIYNLAFTINGENLIDKEVEYGLNKLNEIGLIKNDNVIIPAGLEILSYNEDEEHCEFKINDNMITTDNLF